MIAATNAVVEEGEAVAVMPRHGPKGNPHKKRKKAKKPKKRKKKRASPSFADYGLMVAKKSKQITTARGFTPS